MPSILIVGLGNPGKQYTQTRHNVGWLVVDALRNEWAMEKKWQAELSIHTDVVWCKPQTFMNLSGQAVQAVASFYKIPTGRIIVVYDDKDIPFGVIRARSNGSSGGHNGVKSIIDSLGTDQFGRIRIGIKPTSPIENTADFVLSRWNTDEQQHLPDIITAAQTMINSYVDQLASNQASVVNESFHQNRTVDVDDSQVA